MFSFFKKKKTVAHIKLSGVIGNAGKFKQGIDFAGQEEIIKKAFSLKKASCVAITINSPGGSPVQSHLIYSFIRQEAKNSKKKVIVFAEDVAASGGYLISCAGDEIYANSSSIIGSIGVIYSSFGFTELIKKIGVERRVHTAGKNKSTLDPFLEEKNEDIERLEKIQLDLHKDFIDVVEKSRGTKLNKSEVELFSGEFWSGSKAKELGLIDGIAPEFLENLMWKKFSKEMKREIRTKGIINLKHGEYEYPITYQLIKDGRKNKILNKSINENLKVTMIHGKKDKSVPQIYSKKLLKIFKNAKKKLVLIDNGDHSLSSKKWLRILIKELKLII